MSKELNELRSQGLKPGATSTTSTDDSGFSPDVAGSSPSAIPADDFDLVVETVEIGSVVISAEIAIEAFRIEDRSIASAAASTEDPGFVTIMHVANASERAKARSELGILRNCCEFRFIFRPTPAWSATAATLQKRIYGKRPREDHYLAWMFLRERLSMHLGLPALIDSSSELARVTTCLQEYPIPREFASEIKLQAIITDFTNVLSHTANDGAIDSSILHLLDRELDSLRMAYPDQWPRMLEYSTLVAKLQMYVLVISRDRVGSTARDILLKLSFSTSLRIVYLANMRHNENPSANQCLPTLQQERALPKAYFKGLAFTTAFLLRYFGLNSTASAEEQQLAANHVVLSYSIFTACSVSPADELGRVAKAFEELCQQGPITFDPQQPAPGDRVGVYILMQAMRAAARKRRNDTSSNSESPVPPVSQSITPDPSLIPPDVFGVPMNQTLDPWSADMMFPDQYWNDPAWDALNLPFMEAQFPPR
ncbi:hypothetical protein CHU98_g626 [Xylaria longipes]|nr:hypothetical protein CHU98_g626 [Xylaria longipes]